MRCPVCGSKIADEAKFCPVCKTRLTDEAAEFACPMCGTLVDSEANACPSCGAEFAKDGNGEAPKDEIIPSKAESESKPLEPLVSEELVELVKLKGVGPLKAKALYDAGYTDLRSLKSATVKELASIKGIGKKTAAQIKGELMRIDLDGVRATELTAEDVEAERQCTLCGTILSAFETSCYECGMIFDKSSTVDAKEADLKALEFYEKKLQENPSDTEAWYARGSTLMKFNRLREALASYDQATEIDAKYDGAWIAKADVYRKLGEPKMAADCYNKVISATGAINLLPKTGLNEDDAEVSQDELKEFDLELSQPLEKSGQRSCSTCGEPLPSGVTACPNCGAEHAAKEASVPAQGEPAEERQGIPGTPEAPGSMTSDYATGAEPSAAAELGAPSTQEYAPGEAAQTEAAPETDESPAPQEPSSQPAQSDVVDVASLDEKGLYKLLSESANELKPLLAIAKERSIDVSEGRRLISEAVIYGKKKEVRKAVEIMMDGKRSVKGSMKLRFLREISSLENDIESLRGSGANVGTAVKSIKDAKELLKVGTYDGIPAHVDKAKNDIAAFKKALGG